MFFSFMLTQHVSTNGRDDHLIRLVSPGPHLAPAVSVGFASLEAGQPSPGVLHQVDTNQAHSRLLRLQQVAAFQHNSSSFHFSKPL